ncbi:hypothetical protein CK203_116836 [Vitis vinifera]|uniref:Uncharacterized protein n=1 Tax=Vitis vinifera TaxID=29760 RepID=A0A438CVU8_VITVI|nr:hypothetical protein CK203_116836 [Vitis vinifera]
MEVPYGEFNSVASGHFKPLWDTFQWLGCQHYSKMVTSLSLEGYCTSLSGFFQVYSVCGRRWGKNSVLGRLVVGDQPLGSQYPRLFKVVTDKNILISSILGSVYPFSWNFNFRRNFSDSEIEDLESLMRSSFPTLFFDDGVVAQIIQLAKMDWVPPRSISDMMSINYKGFGLSKRGIVLWQAACIALIWVVWRERNARILRIK